MIGLVMNQILTKCASKVQVAISESLYHESLYKKIEDLVDKFKEPPMLSEDQQVCDLELLEYHQKLFIQAFVSNVILPYTSYLTKENKCQALITLYLELEEHDLISQQSSKKKKIQILSNFGKAYRKLKSIEYLDMSLKLFRQCYDIALTTQNG